MKIAFAVFLFIHAMAHGVGVLTVSGIVKDTDQPTDPTFLLTGFGEDHPIFKVMALLWLVGLIGFAVAGFGVINEADWTLSVLIPTTVLSTALSLIWVKAAPFGLIANLIVIAAMTVPWAADRVIPPFEV